MLKGAFEESDGAALSYFSMAKGARKEANKRKIIAGCFQELLFLTTHGMIELDQRKPYKDILIGKTELFDRQAKQHAAKAAKAAKAAAKQHAGEAAKAMPPPPKPKAK